MNCARRCTLAPRRTTYPSPINWRPCVARSRQMSSGCQLSESSSTAASVVQRWLVRAWSACVSWLHIEASIVCTSNLLTAWRALARIKRCSCASSRRQALRWWLAIACGPSRPGEGLLMPEILAALYARVSSEQQADEHTIDSQVAALRTRVTEDGLLLPAEREFLDEGYSGATLVRPALERLRDLIAAGGIDRLYVHSPDRLARRYAYQALLLDEFQAAGVEVVFLNRTLGQSPEDELLLQVQGMVAEYERAKILERSRRGKRHSAQVGMVSVLGGAPYGYRYIKKDEGSGAARFEIVLDEARVVRQVFQWVGQERATIGEVVRRLTAAKERTHMGKTVWDRTTVWDMLKNPAYMGMAAFGKTQAGPLGPRLRAQRGRPLQPREARSHRDTPPEDWLHIPVPPIVAAAVFAAVHEPASCPARSARSEILAAGLGVLCPVRLRVLRQGDQPVGPQAPSAPLRVLPLRRHRRLPVRRCTRLRQPPGQNGPAGLSGVAGGQGAA